VSDLAAVLHCHCRDSVAGAQHVADGKGGFLKEPEGGARGLPCTAARPQRRWKHWACRPGSPATSRHLVDTRDARHRSFCTAQQQWEEFEDRSVSGARMGL